MPGGLASTLRELTHSVLKQPTLNIIILSAEGILLLIIAN